MQQRQLSLRAHLRESTKTGCKEMIDQINEPSWQEMDKGIQILENALDDIEYHLTRAEIEAVYLKVRKVALEHARISN